MRTVLCALALVTVAISAKAADEPTIKVGSTIFIDYTNAHPNSFNVGRAYLNVTGNLSNRISFRITPDIARELGSGSSLAGSQEFRLKYAFAQLNLDEWSTKGSWIRVGMQQTPLLDFSESTYRYRFQGTMFVEREGYLTSSDSGASFHYNARGDRGDVHAGIYNGEGYSKSEANNQKALQVRATFRPIRGLRTTLFVDADHYASNAKRSRVVAEATYESKHVNSGVDVLKTSDRAVNGRGWSVWVTPRLGNGWELLLRHDDMRPDQQSSVRKHRDIAGIAYWLPGLQKVSSAVLVDVDSLAQSGKPRDRRVGLKLLIAF